MIKRSLQSSLEVALIIIFIAVFVKKNNSEQKTGIDLNTQKNKKMKPDNVSAFKSVNGINMYYEIHGQGMPLVLIHGGGSTIETSFGRILPLFARDRQVIA